MENLDGLYDRLLLETADLLRAAEKNSVEEIGAAIEKRQKTIELLTAFREKAPDEGQKAKIREISILDKKAGAAVRKMYAGLKEDVRKSQARLDGIIQYNSSRYNVANGRILDKKR